MEKDKRTDYKRAFNEQSYDRLAITIPKGAKQALETVAQEAGQSVNGYVNDAIAERMGVSTLKLYAAQITELDRAVYDAVKQNGPSTLIEISTAVQSQNAEVIRSISRLAGVGLLSYPLGKVLGDEVVEEMRIFAKS